MIPSDFLRFEFQMPRFGDMNDLWDRTRELGFPYAIKPSTGSLEQQNGFMPMTLRREETGVEFDVFGRDAVAEFSDAGVDPSYERVANFRWGGDFQEAVAGMCGAAALAKLVDGVVFDEAENRLLSVEDAIAVARANLKQLPPPPKQRSPRGRTLLKRMLAPLLAKRSDLALVRRPLGDPPGAPSDPRGGVPVARAPNGLQRLPLYPNPLSERAAVYARRGR